MYLASAPTENKQPSAASSGSLDFPIGIPAMRSAETSAPLSPDTPRLYLPLLSLHADAKSEITGSMAQSERLTRILSKSVCLQIGTHPHLRHSMAISCRYLTLDCAQKCRVSGP